LEWIHPPQEKDQLIGMNGFIVTELIVLFELCVTKYYNHRDVTSIETLN
jgi:hypothetical protein